MASDVCRVALTCRLVRDAELRTTPAGTSVLTMRVAWNTRRKDQAGEWSEKGNFIDAVLWGNRADVLAQYLVQGKQIALDGRLEFREWEAKDGSGKRQSYEVIVDEVVLLGGQRGERDDGRDYEFEPAGVHGGGGGESQATEPDSDIPF